MCNINWDLREVDLPNYKNIRGLEYGDEFCTFHVKKTYRVKKGTSIGKANFDKKHRLRVIVYDKKKVYMLDYTYFMDHFDELEWQEHENPYGPKKRTKIVPYSVMKEIECECKKEPTHGQGTIF